MPLIMRILLCFDFIAAFDAFFFTMPLALRFAAASFAVAAIYFLIADFTL